MIFGVSYLNLLSYFDFFSCFCWVSRICYVVLSLCWVPIRTYWELAFLLITESKAWFVSRWCFIFFSRYLAVSLSWLAALLVCTCSTIMSASLAYGASSSCFADGFAFTNTLEAFRPELFLLRLVGLVIPWFRSFDSILAVSSNLSVSSC